MVKSLLYSPEVLGGLSILTQGLAGKSPEVVMPSLMQGVQTASAMSKFEDEEDKKKFIEKYKDQVPESDMDLYLYDPQLYIKNREYAKPVKANIMNFMSKNGKENRSLDISTAIGKAESNKMMAEGWTKTARTVTGDTESFGKKAKASSDTKIQNAIKLDAQLEGIEMLHDPRFSTYYGMADAKFAEVMEKLNFKNSKERQIFMVKRGEWESSVQQYFADYRKAITGVAAGEKEIKLLEASVANVNDAPSVFIRKIRLSRALMKQVVERNRVFKSDGGMATFDDKGKPTGKYKEFLSKPENQIQINKEIVIPFIQDLQYYEYTKKQIDYKIKQYFGVGAIEKINKMLEEME